ncbi:MAG: hypothetical protein FJZ08_00020 [Candidatus Omnitrophica bacterium]|nr:hypothetical protein [Candidatus Omnitrophota bacterium]
MGKRLILISLIFIITFYLSAQAQEDKKEEALPSGMEKMKVGRTTELVVPVGTKTYKKGDLVVLESAGEYVARRFAEMEERLLRIEAREEELAEKIEKIDAMFIQIQQELLNSTKEQEE